MSNVSPNRKYRVSPKRGESFTENYPIANSDIDNHRATNNFVRIATSEDFELDDIRYQAPEERELEDIHQDLEDIHNQGLSSEEAAEAEEEEPTSAREVESSFISRNQEEALETFTKSNMPNSEISQCKAFYVFTVLALFIVAFVIGLFVDSLHRINEGKVGIYFVNGALDEKYTYPGIHWSTPFVTDIEQIQIRPTTHTLSAIDTVTRDGIKNSFYGVQVIIDVDADSIIPLIRRYGMEFKDALVFDRIKEELKLFCAESTVDEIYNTKFLSIVKIVKEKVEKKLVALNVRGLKIMNLVIPKPDIPSDIAKNYKQVKVQWTEQLVATQQQKTEKIKKETETIKALLDANRQKEVLQIDIQKEILRKEGEKNLSLLNNQIVKEKEENIADVEAYAKEKQADANKKLYSDAYIKLEMSKQLSNNTKFYFSGPNSPLGALLQKLIN